MSNASDDSVSYKIFAKQLKQIRLRNNMTQEDFAEITGFGYKYYQRIETGKQSDLRFSTLDKFAKALGVTPSRLINPSPIKLRLKLKRKSSPHNKSQKVSHLN